MIDIGEGLTQTTPVYEGYALSLPEALSRTNFGGSDLSDYLMKLLNERYNSLTTSCLDQYIVEYIKKNWCFVSNDFCSEMIGYWMMTPLSIAYTPSREEVGL